MISDSIPWQDELLKLADRLERKSLQTRWTERSSFIVERDIMTSAYAIRRLLEAGKVSRTTYATAVPVLSHTARGVRPDMWNRHKLEELYDLDAPRKAQLSLRKYCNQLIHSYVWGINADEHSGFFDGCSRLPRKTAAIRCSSFLSKALLMCAGGLVGKRYGAATCSEITAGLPFGFR